MSASPRTCCTATSAIRWAATTTRSTTPRSRRPLAVVAYAAAALLVMLPALVALRAESGHWQITPREARIAARIGIPGASTLAGAVARAPGRMAALGVRGIVEQTLHDAKA